MNQHIELYTDGACLGNPGPGGWAALCRTAGQEKELAGHARDTTNNRMELMAAIAGLESLPNSSQVHLFTDSKYVQQGITLWIAGWVKNGWKTAQRKPVKNQDLWQRLQQALSGHNVSWHWVKAHNGHAENERVDALARAQAELAR